MSAVKLSGLLFLTLFSLATLGCGGPSTTVLEGEVPKDPSMPADYTGTTGGDGNAPEPPHG
jgi:hypothetical protein